MRYYFFVTSLENRGGKSPRNTLRPLPGQKFDDGTDIDPKWNVQAPKEKGSSINGNRLDYPEGTVFCGTHLDICTDKSTPYYTVYKTDANGAVDMNPDFHPVSDDPNFQYVRPEHKSDRMNAAYTLFKNFGEQSDGQEEQMQTTPDTSLRPRGEAYSPQKNGKAVGIIPDWKPAYTDQLATESDLLAVWMKRILTEMGISTMARRPRADANTIKMIDQLLRCGESVDTIASKARFDAVYTEQQMDPAGLSTISCGPFEWYLSRLVDEHERGRDCTAFERNPDNAVQIAEGAFIICTDFNNQTGTFHNPGDPSLQTDLKKALQGGWTLDDILHPDVLNAKGDPASLCAALASGVIPLPERIGASRGDSLIQKLMKDKKNAAPKDSEGFHVEERMWKVLVRNLYQKKNTFLKGPSGCGKTEVIQRLCKQTGTPCTLIQMGAITDPTAQLIGKSELEVVNGQTVTRFDWADFAQAIQKPGVIILDEINRCPGNGTNLLFNVLDGNRVLMAADAKSTDVRTIKVNPDCVFFATANIGYQYKGTMELDLALDTRFMTVEVDYLDQKTEQTILVSRCKIPSEDAKNIAIVAKAIRASAKNRELRHSVSTRETLMCAELVKDGFSCEEAMEIAFLPVFENDYESNERDSVRAMIAGRFNTKR